MFELIYAIVYTGWVWSTPPRRRPGRPVLQFCAYCYWIVLLGIGVFWICLWFTIKLAAALISEIKR